MTKLDLLTRATLLKTEYDLKDIIAQKNLSGQEATDFFEKNYNKAFNMIQSNLKKMSKKDLSNFYCEMIAEAILPSKDIHININLLPEEIKKDILAVSNQVLESYNDKEDEVDVSEEDLAELTAEEKAAERQQRIIELNEQDENQKTFFQRLADANKEDEERAAHFAELDASRQKYFDKRNSLRDEAKIKDEAYCFLAAAKAAKEAKEKEQEALFKELHPEDVNVTCATPDAILCDAKNETFIVKPKSKKIFRISEEKKKIIRNTIKAVIIGIVAALGIASFNPNIVDSVKPAAATVHSELPTKITQEMKNTGDSIEQTLNNIIKNINENQAPAVENVSDKQDVGKEAVSDTDTVQKENSQKFAVEAKQDVEQKVVNAVPANDVKDDEEKNDITEDVSKDEAVVKPDTQIDTPVPLPDEQQESDPIVIVDEEHETDPIELEDDQNIPTSDEELDDDKKEETNPEVKDENDVPLDEDVTPEVVQPQDNDEPDLGPGVEIQPEVKSEIMNGIFKEDGFYYYDEEFRNENFDHDELKKNDVLEKLIELAKNTGDFTATRYEGKHESFTVFKDGEIAYAKSTFILDKNPEIVLPPETFDIHEEETVDDIGEEIWNAGSMKEVIEKANEAVQQENAQQKNVQQQGNISQQKGDR